MKHELRKTMKAALAIALIAGLWFSPAAAQSVKKIKANGTIKIGMLVDFPPFGIMNADNQPDGYDADVAKMLAKDLGVAVNLVPVTGPNRIPYLLSGQVDILVASLAITPKRAEKVTFSNPYSAIRIGVFGKIDEDMSSIDKMSGHSIAVARASGQDSSITAIAPSDVVIRRFDDDVSAVQALLSGQVDAIGASNTVMAQIRKVAPGKFDEKFGLNQYNLAVAVKPGDEAMLAYINGFLAKVTASGSLSTTHEKWHDEPLPTFPPISN